MIANTMAKHDAPATKVNSAIVENVLFFKRKPLLTRQKIPCQIAGNPQYSLPALFGLT